MTVYLSSGAFKTTSLATLLAQAEAWDLTHIELSSGMAYADGMRETLCGYADRLDLLVHNYFPPPRDPFVLNLGADDETVHARSVAHCRNAIDLAAELGAGFYSVHSGFAMNMRPEELGRPDLQGRLAAASDLSYERAYARFADTVGDLCDYADAKGIDFLIENNVIAPSLAGAASQRPLLMVEHAEIARFIDDVAHRRLGLLVDTGHTKVSATTLGYAPEKFVDTLAEHIRAFHLSDNDGQADQNLAFDADAWFASYLKDFADWPVVIEAYRLEPDEMRGQIALVSALQEGQRP